MVVKLDNQGRLHLPARIRDELGIQPGAEWILSCREGTVELTTRGRALQAAQDRLARFVRPGISVVDEFIAERRKGL